MNIADAELKIARLDFKPGDMLVVQMPFGAEDEDMRRVHGQLRHILVQHYGGRVGVLVIPHGLDLSVLTRAEIEARS